MTAVTWDMSSVDVTEAEVQLEGNQRLKVIHPFDGGRSAFILFVSGETNNAGGTKTVAVTLDAAELFALEGMLSEIRRIAAAGKPQ